MRKFRLFLCKVFSLSLKEEVEIDVDSEVPIRITVHQKQGNETRSFAGYFFFTGFDLRNAPVNELADKSLHDSFKALLQNDVLFDMHFKAVEKNFPLRIANFVDRP